MTKGIPKYWRKINNKREVIITDKSSLPEGKLITKGSKSKTQFEAHYP